MILVDKEIKGLIAEGSIKVDPYDESLVNPASLDFRLGDILVRTRATQEIMSDNPFGNGGTWSSSSSVYPYVDPADKDSFKDEVIDLKNLEKYYLKPGEFVLASAMESLTLPDNLAVKIFGKSSLGRLGLANSEVAGWVDPGWPGVLTLELKNHHHRNAIVLRPGMKIGQYVFMRTSSVPEKPYGVTGRYQNQTPGQGSKGI